MEKRKNLSIKRIAFILIVMSLIVDTGSAHASQEFNAKELFKFYRVNYKEDKVLHYDMLSSDDCKFTGKRIDPYYFIAKNNKRIELNKDSYFIPKSVRVVSDNHIMFKFKALGELIGKGAYVNAYIYKAKNDEKALFGDCIQAGIIKIDGKYLAVDSIYAKLKLIFKKPAGIKKAEAVVYEAIPTGDPDYPFEFDTIPSKLCMYGKDCDKENREQEQEGDDWLPTN